MFMPLLPIFTRQLLLQPGEVLDVTAAPLAGQLGSDFPFC